MPNRKNNDFEFLCWFCDYGLLILAILLILTLSFVFRLTLVNFLTNYEISSDAPSTIPTMMETVVPIQTEQIEIEVVQTEIATAVFEITATAQPTQTPIPQTPEFIIAFIPVHWVGYLEEFEEAVVSQFNHFVDESNISEYFDVRYVIITENLLSTSWGEASLVLDVIEFGLLRSPADRYMGLTNNNLSLDGDYWVAGWTMGEDFLGAVGEEKYLAITAHELGHTFGLCDEYSFNAWSFQNSMKPLGCPNPFPAECNSLIDRCDPGPNDDGHYSIMGFAREDSYQVFNGYCVDGFRQKFEQLIRRRE